MFPVIGYNQNDDRKNKQSYKTSLCPAVQGCAGYRLYSFWCFSAFGDLEWYRGNRGELSTTKADIGPTAAKRSLRATEQKHEAWQRILQD